MSIITTPLRLKSSEDRVAIVICAFERGGETYRLVVKNRVGEDLTYVRYETSGSRDYVMAEFDKVDLNA